jgi:hypothetical protein
VVLGLIGGMAYAPFFNSGLDILDQLNQSGNTLARVTYFIFPFVVNLTSIPIVSIIIRYNLMVNGVVASKHWANFWSVVFPWLITIPYVMMMMMKGSRACLPHKYPTHTSTHTHTYTHMHLYQCVCLFACLFVCLSVSVCACFCTLQVLHGRWVCERRHLGRHVCEWVCQFCVSIVLVYTSGAAIWRYGSLSLWRADANARWCEIFHHDSARNRERRKYCKMTGRTTRRKKERKKRRKK